MKIRDDNSGISRGAQPAPKPVEAARAEHPGPARTAPSPTDRVELSDRARALHLAQRALAQLPPTDEEQVRTLKEMVKAGAYRVSAERVAGRMLGEGLLG